MKLFRLTSPDWAGIMLMRFRNSGSKQAGRVFAGDLEHKLVAGRILGSVLATDWLARKFRRVLDLQLGRGSFRRHSGHSTWLPKLSEGVLEGKLPRLRRDPK